MTMALSLLKTLLGKDYILEQKLTDEDLTAYLTLASNSIKRHIGCEEIDDTKYYVDLARIAQLNLLKAGAEGQIEHSENGIDRVYTYPDIEMEVLKNILTILK